MDTEERLLWEQWRDQGDSNARSRLITKYSSWARLVARSIYTRIYALGDAWEDCSQNALIGLLEAVDRYDPERGVHFELYARHRVRGAVFNGLRLLRESLAQGPRERTNHEVIRDRIESLRAEEFEDPLDAFVSTTVGLGLGFLLEAHSLPGQESLSDAYAATEHAQQEAAMTQGVELLPERERMILVLHYYHHVPFVQVALQLGVTKGRVSQLHKQALERLRVHLKAHIEATL